jgi:hypothetical protein
VPRVIRNERFRLKAHPDDADGETLLFWYPAITAKEGDYLLDIQN